MNLSPPSSARSLKETPPRRVVPAYEIVAPSIHFWKGGTIALDRIEIPKNIVVVRDK